MMINDPILEPLVRDLVHGLAEAAQPYNEVMAAWRTSCPRLPVWETAVDFGLIHNRAGVVSATEAGRAWLAGMRSP
jgi:hypothetical protein